MPILLSALTRKSKEMQLKIMGLQCWITSKLWAYSVTSKSAQCFSGCKITPHKTFL